MKNLKSCGSLLCKLSLLIAVVLIASCSSTNKIYTKSNKILVFTKAAAFKHGSIKPAALAIMKLGAENHIVVDTTSDVNKFTTDNLKQYAALVFVSTTGTLFKTEESKAALKNYIEHGGGYVGIHAASDSEYDWQWYGDLVGAYFLAHPSPQMATVVMVDPNTIATKHLPAQWKRLDEWYSFKYVAKDIHVLLKLDETGMNYGRNDKIKMGDNHPLAWYHDYDGGRSFYTELGHTNETYLDPAFLQHLLGGIEYAMGKKKMQL